MLFTVVSTLEEVEGLRCYLLFSYHDYDNLAITSLLYLDFTCHCVGAAQKGPGTAQGSQALLPTTPGATPPGPAKDSLGPVHLDQFSINFGNVSMISIFLYLGWVLNAFTFFG